MNVETIWEAPPPKKTGRRLGGERARWLAVLKEHPGQWAKWPRPTANGATTWFRKHGCEVAMRMIAGSDPKRFDLYVRYVGQDGAT